MGGVTTTTAPNTHLSTHQREGVDWLLGRPRGYLADDPGLGKTRQLLEAVYEAGARRVLVVAPAMVRDAGVWPDEAAKIGLEFEALDVTSYHSMAKSIGTPYDALIFDEAHRLKNRKVGWAKAASTLANQIDRVYLASGTPIPNQAEELWAQLSYIRQMPAYWPWIRKYFEVVQTQWSPASITGRLRDCTSRCHGMECEHWARFTAENLEGYFLRRTRDQVLRDLPPISGHDTPYWVPMQPAQAKAYRDIRKSFIAQLPDGSVIEARSFPQQFAQLLMASTGLSSVDPTQTKGNSKLEATLELLEGRVSPTLVVCYFRSTAKVLLDAIPGAIGIGGATSRPDREKAVRAFQSGDVPVLVGSVGVIKEGLTLTAADLAIMVERAWTPGDNEQAIRRIHRMGQTNPVVVRQLVTPESVDANQWATLGHKAEHIDGVLAPLIKS